MRRWFDIVGRSDTRLALRAHRLAGLIADTPASPDEPAWVTETRKIARTQALEFAMHDLALSAMLKQVVVALDAAGVDALVFKGGAFAEWLYASSHHRPRLDLDILCRDGWAGVERAAGVLAEHGFWRVHQLPGRLAVHAVALASRDGLTSIDLHARVNRRFRLAKVLPVEELFERAIEVGRDVTFRTLSPADAMIVSLTHGATHHGGQTPPAIWLEDQARLAARMDAEGWRFVVACAEAASLRSVMKPSLERLIAWEGEAVPSPVVELVSSWRDDASAVFASPSHAVRILDDLEFLTPTEWVTYLGELLFPPRSYMVEEFGVAREGILPAMWLRRLRG